MIRIAVMLDAKRVIGASNPEENAKRFPLLPVQLKDAMEELYSGENIAGGESSWKMPTSLATNKRYVITRNELFDTEGENIEIVTDAQVLIDRYKDSDDELLIVGGLSMFNLFTPYTQVLQIAEAHELVPGDVVFDKWENEPFQLIATEEWEGFDVKTYKRI